MAPKHVMISYSHEDTHAAELIHKALKGAGVEVFRDNKIRIGEGTGRFLGHLKLGSSLELNRKDSLREMRMSDQKGIVRKPTTIVTGQGGKVITQKPQVTSSTGKVVQKGNQVDVALVFDTTGSMSDKINKLLDACREFVQEASSLELDLQIALISFGDISYQGGGDRIELVVPLTDDVDKILHGLANIPRNNGFGNDGESSLEALETALEISYRTKAVKVIILITDEPALQHRIAAEQMIQRLLKREFLVFAIATSHQYYKDMGYKTGGDWEEISPSSDLSVILEKFRNMVKKAAKTAKQVHLLGGSVEKYRLLNPPKK